MTGVALVVSLAMLTTSCHKDETNNNGSNNGNTENPGGGGAGGGSGNQEYPSTAVVLPNAVEDINGNHYDAVLIGNQVWMAENLRTTRYADGTTIPLGAETSEITSYRYNPNNDANNVPTYGYLYNWPAVMHGESSSSTNPSGVQGICPNGWHVPSEAEWSQLTAYLGSHSEYVCSGSDDKIAKALASTSGWQLYNGDECAVGNNPSTNNATGFSALPAGEGGDNYYRFGNYAYFWSATEYDDNVAYYYYLFYNYAYVNTNFEYGYSGRSVRCVRD